MGECRFDNYDACPCGCGKCLGRISDEDNDFSRKVQAKLHPGAEWKPPRVCAACVLETIMSWPDGDEMEADCG